MVMRGWVAWVVVVASGAGLAGGCTFQDDSCADGFRCARIPDGSSSSSDGDSQASDSGASSGADTASGSSSSGDSAADSGTDTAPDCEATDPKPVLKFENRTGNTVETFAFVACDGTMPSEFPLQPPGLPTDQDVEVPLPGPGCWLMSYSGDGCTSEMPFEATVCAGETVVWTADDVNHVCIG
ncbi:MAG: hypothetical protein IPH07_33515 [Deltaproteobacteria bacterium]|nr:hypothetical protein [Deltaproteobacteria bacterium]MBK8716583.1 hypothetical protein [Deltaproteobacteria bacterium]MBP7289495.1 hypothetical protein [Nannocystaceae bacterium]